MFKQFLIFFCLILQVVKLNSQIRFPDDDAGSNSGYSLSSSNRWFLKLNCISYRYNKGYCVPIKHCDELKNSKDFNILRRSLCGFYGNDPKVCCPDPKSSSGSRDYSFNNGNSNYGSSNNNNYNNNNSNKYETIHSSGRESNSFKPVVPKEIDDNDFTYPSQLPKSCGVSSKEATRIVGGSPALPGAWPWMASLQYGKAGHRSHICGASLISKNLILTASHCLTDDDEEIFKPNLLSVKLGEHNIDQDTPDDASEEYDVSEVYIHPNYNNRNFISDLAVLKLKKNVKFSNRIFPVCLPYDSVLLRKNNLSGRSALITGWGTTKFDGNSSPILLQATLKITPESFCKEAFKKWFQITKEYLCAASEGFDKDSCQGDSGGPLVMYDNQKRRWYLVGIVSFGKKCATPDVPGVYTRITTHLNYLKQFF